MALVDQIYPAEEGKYDILVRVRPKETKNNRCWHQAVVELRTPDGKIGKDENGKIKVQPFVESHDYLQGCSACERKLEQTVNEFVVFVGKKEGWMYNSALYRLLNGKF